MNVPFGHHGGLTGTNNFAPVAGPACDTGAGSWSAQQACSDGAPELTLICAAPTGGTSEINRLVEQHQPLVAVLVSERLRNVPRHIRRDELMSAGMLALVLSAAAYDPLRGVPFRSFAAFRIRGALIDELRAMDWASRSVRTRAREVESARARLVSTLDQPPCAQDVADALGMSTGELHAVDGDTARGTVLSLQSLSIDALPDGPAGELACPETLILYREQLGYLHDAIETLPDRLRFVVLAHFFEQRKMVDIAHEMCVTQSRVSQLCTEAIALIREGMNSQLNPDGPRTLSRVGRAGALREAYCRALADRSTLAGRLEFSTAQGEMRRSADVDHEDPLAGLNSVQVGCSA